MKPATVNSGMKPGVTVSPDDVQRKWLAAMRGGDFEAAWRVTDAVEVPRRLRGSRNESVGELLWDGTPFNGRRVLVQCLHGLGDTLQFMRLIPEVRKVASHVYFAVQPALLPLLAGDPALGEVINGWVHEWPEHDVAVEVMELAYALRVSATAIPGSIPSLDLERIRRASRWQPPASQPGKPRVGLVWQASSWDPSRSVPPGVLHRLAPVDADFYSLQQDVRPEELYSVGIPITDLAPGTADALDAAAAMMWLDLVITVDSMPAHLGGVLGRPAWVLLKGEGLADWRWMENRSTSPWYPTLRLFRQNGDWSDLVGELADALAAGGET